MSFGDDIEEGYLEQAKARFEILAIKHGLTGDAAATFVKENLSRFADRHIDGLAEAHRFFRVLDSILDSQADTRRGRAAELAPKL